MKLLKLFKWTVKHWKEITPSRIWNFLKAYQNKISSSAAPSYYDWKLEQFDWRYAQVKAKSPACIEQGACVKCGCDIPDKFFEPDACEEGCYPEWMEKEQWLNFKTTDEWRTSQKTI